MMKKILRKFDELLYQFCFNPATYAAADGDNYLISHQGYMMFKEELEKLYGSQNLNNPYQQDKNNKSIPLEQDKESQDG